jgi:hypothetical protein
LPNWSVFAGWFDEHGESAFHWLDFLASLAATGSEGWRTPMGGKSQVHRKHSKLNTMCG